MATKKSVPREDARVLRSKRVVLDTTVELLVEHGLSGLSVDEVSRRSGVAKTTIYRHWPTRADLVRSACAQLGTAQATPDAGSLDKDVGALLSNLARLLRTAKWPSVMPSIADGAERDPELATLIMASQVGHAKPYLEVIARGKRNGELPARADAQTLVSELVGPLFFRRWFSREPVDEAFVKSVVRHVLGGHRVVS